MGVIYQDLLAQNNILTDYEYMYAIFWHNKYHSHFSPESFTEAYAALEKGLEKNPENSLLNSIKAQLLLDQRTMETEFETDPLEEGMNLALKAISIDNYNQHAWLMLGWTSILSHNREKGVEALDKCISINPNNNLIQSASGFGLICAGEYEAGWDLLNQSTQSPYYFWVTNTGLCLYHLQGQNFEEAYYWARLVKRPNFIWDPLLRLCCAVYLENDLSIMAAKEELLKLSPNFTSKARRLVGAFLLDDHLQNTILDSLQKAGLKPD